MVVVELMIKRHKLNLPFFVGEGTGDGYRGSLVEEEFEGSPDALLLSLCERFGPQGKGRRLKKYAVSAARVSAQSWVVVAHVCLSWAAQTALLLNFNC